MIRQLGLKLLMVLMLASGGVQAETLTAFVDRNRIGLDETLQLSVRIDSQMVLSEPDFSGLKADFDILGTRQSRQMRSVNGKSESWTQWTLTLAPKREGLLQIPALKLKGARSQPLTIEVRAPAQPETAADRDYYLELELDKEQLHVQEQLLVRVRLLSAISLSGLQGAALTVDGANVSRLDERQYERIQRGRRYGVFEVSYVVFPQRSGPLEIPAQRFSAVKNASRSVFGRSGGQRIRISSDARTVNVLPRPSSFPAAEWLPTTELQLTQSWGKGSPEFRVGEPVTRTLKLKVSGVETTQVPLIRMVETAGLKLYPEQPETEESSNADGLQLERTERFGLVPSKPGTLELPAIRIRWWDIRADRERVAELPAETISVLPAAVTTATAVLPESLQSAGAEADTPISPVGTGEGNRDLLLWSNLAWALACSILALLWWRARKGHSGAEPPGKALSTAVEKTEARAFKRLEQACDDGDPGSVRAALLSWQQSRSSGTRPSSATGFEALLREAQDPEIRRSLQQQLRQLDRTLYSSDSTGSYSPGPLLQALRRLRKQKPAGASAAGTDLPPLYGHS